MRLLIITQKVNKNDPILGFFHRWIEEFAKYCEDITVVCLELGEYNFSNKVKVLSLGKPISGWQDLGWPIWWGKILALANFYKYLWRERNNYDRVFVHMNPIYIIWSGWWWKLSRKPITLWYTHARIDWKLRLAEKIVDRIFSASAESFRLKSKKLVITGHGIDTEVYRPIETKKDKQVILSVGRLSRTKNHHLIVEAFSQLKEVDFPRELWLAGEAIYKSDQTYKQELVDLIEAKNLTAKVKMFGAVTPDKMPAIYQQADLLVNLSDTGSLDKVVLEAMASEVKIVSSNEAYQGILPNTNLCSKKPREISVTIENVLSGHFDISLRDYVIKNHNLTKLIDLLIKKLAELK